MQNRNSYCPSLIKVLTLQKIPFLPPNFVSSFFSSLFKVEGFREGDVTSIQKSRPLPHRMKNVSSNDLNSDTVFSFFSLTRFL